MSCEHLICAQCAAPVAEGRCPACRATRQHVHHNHLGVGPQLLVAGILALALLLILVTYLGK
jgi:uncharacterized paraquat-inducible protein A